MRGNGILWLCIIFLSRTWIVILSCIALIMSMSSEKREIQVVVERVLCIDPAVVVAILDLDTDVSEAARTVAKLAKEDFFYYAVVPSPSHARHTSHTRPLSSSQPVLLKT